MSSLIPVIDGGDLGPGRRRRVGVLGEGDVGHHGLARDEARRARRRGRPSGPCRSSDRTGPRRIRTRRGRPPRASPRAGSARCPRRPPGRRSRARSRRRPPRVPRRPAPSRTATWAGRPADWGTGSRAQRSSGGRAGGRRGRTGGSAAARRCGGRRRRLDDRRRDVHRHPEDRADRRRLGDRAGGGVGRRVDQEGRRPVGERVDVAHRRIRAVAVVGDDPREGRARRLSRRLTLAVLGRGQVRELADRDLDLGAGRGQALRRCGSR